MLSSKYILDFQDTKVVVNKRPFVSLLNRGIALLKKQPHLKGKLYGGRVEIAFVNDKKIALINQKYRGKNKPTDVISLSYFETDYPIDNLVGEIIISVETAQRQAKEHRKTLPQELQFLFAHGLLHIFGYDHETPAERKVMFDLQDKILATKKWRRVAEKPFNS